MSYLVEDGIDWVGCVDWNVRDFHGYETDRGTSYNAYLVRDEKNALIDTVKAPFVPQLLERLRAQMDLSAIDYVVCNHAEPDHAGGLGDVLRELRNAELVCNKKCAAALGKHFDTSAWRSRIVNDADRLSLGKKTLRFIDTPMLHWPESMWTYLEERAVLFSMDAFGQHYAASYRFDDEVPWHTLMEEAQSYFANILMPCAKQTIKALATAGSLDLRILAPSHGVAWRRRVNEIVKAYGDWAAFRVKPKVVVLYDSMWGSTEEMAHAILDGAVEGGVEVQLFHIRRTHLATIATHVLDSAGVAVGSSTLNAGMMPMAAAALTYLKGLRPVGKVGLAFGSSGWGRGGPEGVHEILEAMRWEIVGGPLRSQYRPTQDLLAQCRQTGRELALKAQERSAAAEAPAPEQPASGSVPIR